MQWSVGSRLIGFEKDRHILGETQPRTCWVICESVPVSVAVDRLRPCTPAELLASHYTQTRSSSPLATDTQIQQGFIDERAQLNPTTVDQSRTADEGEDEDERDDEMLEPTQLTSAEKRKKIQTDETAKELRAPLPTGWRARFGATPSPKIRNGPTFWAPFRREWVPSGGLGVRNFHAGAKFRAPILVRASLFGR